jgi:lambda repressor-like predicted transcriptional regulator
MLETSSTEMTPAHKKAKITLIEQGRTFRDLSNTTGLAQTVISNTLSGRTANRRTRRAITNALGVQLWDDVPVTERLFTFPPGTEIEFPSENAARDGVREFPPGVARRTGIILTFVQPVTIEIEVKPEETQSVKNRKISADSIE